MVDYPFCFGLLEHFEPSLPSTTDLLKVFASFKDQLRIPFFMEVVIAMCWFI
jgi:hypothetical protein